MFTITMIAIAWGTTGLALAALDTADYLYNTRPADRRYTPATAALILALYVLLAPVLAACRAPRWLGMLAGLLVRQYMEGYRVTR